MSAIRFQIFVLEWWDGRVQSMEPTPEWTWKSAILDKNATIRDGIKAIDTGRSQVALVVDADDRLLGIITDGDVRRALLAGRQLSEPITAIMRADPIIGRLGIAHNDAVSVMRRHNVAHLPIVDNDGRIAGLELIREVSPVNQDVCAVIMAGGFGKRLAPLTDRMPKPLLPIGEIPMIERIICSLVRAKVTRIVVSVFHMSDQVRAFCGDGSKWGAHITYIEENEPRGTAGALSLLDERPNRCLIVINCDILTNLNFESLLYFHYQQENRATMCVREQQYQLNYGIVKFDGPYVVEIDEKPVHKYFINAGIYVLNADVLDLIPKSGYFDMPNLLRMLADRDTPPAAFMIREHWLDIGTHEEFEKAHALAAIVDKSEPSHDQVSLLQSVSPPKSQ